MIRLEQIRIDPNAPAFAKPHPKQESIWHRQYPVGFASANLKEYPQRGSEVNAWRQGILEARQLAIAVGMAPRFQRDDNDSDSDEDDSGESDSNDDHGNDDDSDDDSSGDSNDGDDDDKGPGQRDGVDSNDNIDNDALPIDDNDDWFYKPFSYPKNRFHGVDGNNEDGDDSEDNCDEEETSACGPCLSGMCYSWDLIRFCVYACCKCVIIGYFNNSLSHIIWSCLQMNYKNWILMKIAAKSLLYLIPPSMS
jgi:hypothetical protein